MKIKKVLPNNRKKMFEVIVNGGSLLFPYARLRVRPEADNRVIKTFVDPELGNEAFTYTLARGQEDNVHIDQVLEYNNDPNYFRNLLIYRLTVEAQKCLGMSDLSRREIVRRLGTSASQFYRLLDQTNYRKSVSQLFALLSILGCEVDLDLFKEDQEMSKLPLRIRVKLKKEAREWDSSVGGKKTEEISQLIDKAELFVAHRPPRQPVSVRLDPFDLAMVKRLARRKGIPFTQLISMWLHEKIEEEKATAQA